jgi:Fe-S-cluster-containing hydrogenase component 2/bacterioferritin-associated ferredoxin
MENGVLTDGFPSQIEIAQTCGCPDLARMNRGPVALIECVQEIPCNPCEAACKFGAIHIGECITNIPKLDWEKCTGCSQCVAACPGLAIFVVDKSYSQEEATISFPFEYFPLPTAGNTVDAVSRAGEVLCQGRVLRVLSPKQYDHTAVITIAVAQEYADSVRSIARGNKSGIGFEDSLDESREDDSVIVCRCEEITAGEIRKAIREYKATSITEVKRRVRSGMGLCQGKTCSKQISRILCEELGGDLSQKIPDTSRSPVRPISFGELSREGSTV